MIYLWAIVHTRTWCCCCCCSISHLPHSYTCTKMINWWERKLNFMSIWFWIKDAFLLHVLYVIFAAAVSRNYGLIIKLYSMCNEFNFFYWNWCEFHELIVLYCVGIWMNFRRCWNLVTLCHQSSCILMLEYSKNSFEFNIFRNHIH